MGSAPIAPIMGWKEVGTSFYRHLNVVEGDIIYLDDGSNQEFVQIARISYSSIIEEWTRTSRKTKNFKHLFLTKGTTFSYGTGWTPWRVYRNPYWETFGCFRVTEDIGIGDNIIQVENTQVRLIPTLYSEGIIEDASCLPQSGVTDYTYGVPNWYWTVEGVLQPFHMEYKTPSPGQLNYNITATKAPIVAGTVTIWVKKEGRWEFLQDNALGNFTATSYGAGSIDYTSGLITVSLNGTPDYGTLILFQYEMTTPHKIYQGSPIGTGSGSLPVGLTFPITTPIAEVGTLIEFEDSTGYNWKVQDDLDGNLYWNRERFLPDQISFSTPVSAVAFQSPTLFFYDSAVNYFFHFSGASFYRSTDGKNWTVEPIISPIGGLGAFITYGNIQLGCSNAAGGSQYEWRSNLGTWSTGTLGVNGAQIFAAYLTATSMWIIVQSNGRVWYGTSLSSMTNGGLIPGSLTFVTGISNRNNRVMVVGSLTNCYVYDTSFGTPDATNWVSKPGYLMSGAVKKGVWDDEYDSWIFVGDSSSCTMTQDFGDNWTTHTTTFIGMVGATRNLFNVESDRRGRLVVTIDGQDDLLTSWNGGGEWHYWETMGHPATYRWFPKVCWNWESELMILYCNGTGATSAWFMGANFNIKEMTGLTDDLVGSINYDSRTATISLGKAPYGTVYGEYYVTTKNTKTLTVFMNGASDIVLDSFRVRARRQTEAYELMEIKEEGGVITGDGTGTLYKEHGYANVTFDYEFDPDTVRLDYSFLTLVVTEFEFNYDVIDKTLFPANGLVPGVKTGDTVIIYDKTNPKKSLSFAKGTWDLVTWDNDDGGDPGPGSYNFVSNPMSFYVAGTTTDRWAIYIKSVTTPDVLYVADIYQESQGATPVLADQQVGTGASGDLTVTNPVTGVGYWTLEKAGWSADWVAGNVLRINTSANDDMMVVQDVYTDRIVTLQTASNEYLAENTHVATAVIFGDLVSNKSLSFDQNTWDTVTWQDTQQGAAAPANYDWATYPLVLTNAGTITERWGIFFTQIITPNQDYKVSVYSETHGVVLADQRIGPGVSGGGVDLAPLNPATGVPYWTMRNEGWGAGWAVNNLVRFNTVGADRPVWIVRVINARSSSQIDDAAEIQVRGDVS